MAKKKVSQSELRQMMQKMKGDTKGRNSDRLKKLKLSSREQALIEADRKRKAEEEEDRKRKFARSAGVPDNFFDSAKTKAYLNLNKAPQKSILKKGGGQQQQGKANAKATGKEWTSSEPVISRKQEKTAVLKTPSGGSIQHDDVDEGPNQVPSDFFDGGKEGGTSAAAADGDADKQLPEGFFDDPIADAKARGIEYKNPEEEEWEAFKKEIAVEVAVSQDIQAEDELEETVERQIDEIDDQMRAWTRVREIEKKKDIIEQSVKVKKEEPADEIKTESDEDVDEADIEEFLDWRKKKS